MSTTSPTAPSRATLADLAKAPGKAELIGGEVVPLMPSGLRPNLVAGRIYRSLADHADATGLGVAVTDNMGFAVPELPSGRETFSPDVAYYDGPFSADDMRFIQGPPTFAVEVRSEGDYGPSAEHAMAGKRADYFAAGTPLVWDVDPIANVVLAYRADAADRPTMFARGQDADAEPAVPGWRMAVDRIFP
ncbi:MAG TPA: Uma2 family endonuclease [Isosphaeraceae bacterium]|jgi:Uma2 family endonuclease|nr:Uma2 family endonuclease [Isosphaeraceae bacterium]